MEHSNQMFKDNIHMSHSHLTTESIHRAVTASTTLKVVLDHFNKAMHVKPESGKNEEPDDMQDVELISVENFNGSQSTVNNPPRCHSKIPCPSREPFTNIRKKTLHRCKNG